MPGGRKPKLKRDRKSNLLGVCLTNQQRALINKAAGGETSAWAREILVRAALKKVKSR